MATSKTGYTPTYDDFTTAMNRAGLTRQNFSDADWALAQNSPEFGLTAVSYKSDWMNAKDDAAKALAHEGLENARKAWGGYTSKADGTGYYAYKSEETEPEPEAFVEEEPSFDYQAAIDELAAYKDNSSISRAVDDSLEKLQNYGEFTPSSNRYQEALDTVMNAKEFSYDKDSDPNYAAYKKEYLREGDRATQNALASAASASAGRTSSYAQTAATQAGDYYAGQLSDKIPEMYDAAYERYLNERNLEMQRLSAALTERQQEFSEWQQNYSNLLSSIAVLQGQDSVEYQRKLDEYNLRVEAEAAEQAKIQQKIENAQTNASLFGTVSENDAAVLGVSSGSKTLSAQAQEAELDLERRQVTLDEANSMADNGDFSGYAALGATDEQIQRMQDAYDTQVYMEKQQVYATVLNAQTNATEAETNRIYKEETLALAKAAQAAEYGDFSGYESLGWSADAVKTMRNGYLAKLEIEQQKANTDAYEAQVNAQYKSESLALEKAAQAALYGDFSGYKNLGYSDESIAAMKEAYQAEKEMDALAAATDAMNAQAQYNSALAKLQKSEETEDGNDSGTKTTETKIDYTVGPIDEDTGLPSYTDDMITKSNALKAYKAGYRSDKVMEYMLDMGYTEEQLVNASVSPYTGDYFDNLPLLNRERNGCVYIDGEGFVKWDNITADKYTVTAEKSGGKYFEVIRKR